MTTLPILKKMLIEEYLHRKKEAMLHKMITPWELAFILAITIPASIGLGYFWSKLLCSVGQWHEFIGVYA